MAHDDTRRLSRTAGNGSEPNDLWAIVLAAGEGTRLASVTRRVYGRDVPKQFAAFDGEQTLLQGTMERIRSLVPPGRTVVVVAKHQLAMAEEQLARYPGVMIVAQPKNAGTGPGVMLPMAVVKAHAPDAKVLITPSDHHIPRPREFIFALETALEASDQATSGITLIGAQADAPASDLGWIVPLARAEGAATHPDVASVEAFVEKPPAAVAKELFNQGGLWNTLILVGSVAAFWQQGTVHLPRQMALLERYVSALAGRIQGAGIDSADSVLADLYGAMPTADFSRCVLQVMRGLNVVRLRNSGWCDCGTPERLLASLEEGTTGRRQQLLRSILRAVQAEQSMPVATATGPIPFR